MNTVVVQILVSEVVITKKDRILDFTYNFLSKVYKVISWLYVPYCSKDIEPTAIVHIGCHKDTGYFLLLCLNFSQECVCGV